MLASTLNEGIKARAMISSLRFFELYSKSSYALILCVGLIAYLAIVRLQRFARMKRIQMDFGYPSRSLDSMTYQESASILRELEELEFPFSFRKARTLALLKTGSIPAMTRLFAATGQNNAKQGPKRSLDTKILLLEMQLNEISSARNNLAISRINYFHDRYRKAGKIRDHDLLHTLGDNALEQVKGVNQREWRQLSPVELCAIGVYHRGLGDDLKIPFDALPSYNATADGHGDWKNGIDFVHELIDWTERYAEKTCMPDPKNFAFASTYIGVETWFVPPAIRPWLQRIVAVDLDGYIADALGLARPGTLLRNVVHTTQKLRRWCLRYLALPRPAWLASVQLDRFADPVAGRSHFPSMLAQPWYSQDRFWSTSFLLRLLFGGGRSSDAYHDDGYSLWSIGPTVHEGKGGAEMRTDLEQMGLRNRGAQCPFSHRKKLTEGSTSSR